MKKSMRRVRIFSFLALAEYSVRDRDKMCGNGYLTYKCVGSSASDLFFS
jgi:hypothetical protein